MVAMDPSANPTFLQFLAWKIGKALDRSATKQSTRVTTIMQAIIKLMLHIVGFSCLTIAGFYWHVIAGLVVAGISCFILSWLLTTPTTAGNSNRPPQR